MLVRMIVGVGKSVADQIFFSFGQRIPDLTLMSQSNEQEKIYTQRWTLAKCKNHECLSLGY